MISIIISIFNQEENIAATIAEIKNRDKENCFWEIIVSDRKSTDKTVAIASNTDATLNTSEKKGRAAQMNLGASIA